MATCVEIVFSNDDNDGPCSISMCESVIYPSRLKEHILLKEPFPQVHRHRRVLVREIEELHNSAKEKHRSVKYTRK